MILTHSKFKKKYMKEENNLRYLLTILFLLVLFTTPFLFSQIRSNLNTEEEIAIIKIEEKKVPFENLILEAKAVYVFDMATGNVLYSYNEDEKLPLASLTKMMTAIVATDILPMSTVITIDPEDIKEEGDSGLLVDERWRLSDIIDFTLTSSSNDGASAVASVAGSLGQTAYGAPKKQAKSNFVQKMNEKTQGLGLTSTYFLNETGLDIDDSLSGSYGTAKETAHIMAYAIKNKINVLEATSRDLFYIESLNNIEHTATNTNEHVNKIPGIIASKTGFTDLAGGNLVVAFDAGLMHPIIISILGSTIDGRFEDVEKLTLETLQALVIHKRGVDTIQ